MGFFGYPFAGRPKRKCFVGPRNLLRLFKFYDQRATEEAFEPRISSLW